MGWSGALLTIAGYILLGRLLLPADTRWRAVGFAFLNLGTVYVCFFREIASGASWLGVYIGLVAVQYAALHAWAERRGPWPWLAFALPIAALVAVRYFPVNLAAAHSAWFRAKLAAEPDYRLSARLVGLSYLAFRSSALVLEVRNRVVPRPTFSQYLGFAFFAPTLSVGPINPWSEQRRGVLQGGIALPASQALLRILVGAVKYRFLGPMLNQLTYSSLLLDGHLHGFVDLALAGVAYYLYLYCNFSGFCDLAIGIAALLGVPVLENFNRPFAAVSVKDFWNRWHITLSLWMREIVFSPLSKVLVRAWGPVAAPHAIGLTIVVVFLLVGIWHGAGWNYLLFGAVHAAGVAANHYWTLGLKRRLGKARYLAYQAHAGVRAVSVSLTFCYVAASLFFFANSLVQIRQIFSALRWP